MGEGINVLAAKMNGKVVHEEAVDWDPPGDPVDFDVCGTDFAPAAPK